MTRSATSSAAAVEYDKGHKFTGVTGVLGPVSVRSSSSSTVNPDAKLLQVARAPRKLFADEEIGKGTSLAYFEFVEMGATKKGHPKGVTPHDAGWFSSGERGKNVRLFSLIRPGRPMHGMMQTTWGMLMLS